MLEDSLNWYYDLQTTLMKTLGLIEDPRNDDCLLMNSYAPTILLTILYLLIVHYGPKFMENRKAYYLKWQMLIYNCSVMLLNMHIFSELFICSIKLRFSLICQPCTGSTSPCHLRIARAVWWYYFSKLIEFNDTFIFILRKKNSQISFLHVFHHATMFPIWYIGARFMPCGDGFFGPMLNSLIHVLMYTYYALAGLGEKYQKFIWWKKYMTKIQLIQFCMGIAHSASSIIFPCGFMMWPHVALISYALIMMYLFLDFYRQTYKAKTVEHLNNGDVKKIK